MRKGFTLIEILIVIVIIGILAGVLISVINPNAMYSKARDSRRQSDLKTLQTGLENYYAEHRTYPSTSSGWRIANSGSTLQVSLAPFLNNYPYDPTSTQNYRYWSDGFKYCLAAQMENTIAETEKLCSSLKNFGVCGSPGITANVCLGAENPF